MSRPRPRQRRKLTALAAAVVCSVLSLFISSTTAAGDTSSSSTVIGLPGVPLTISSGGISLSTGLITAKLSKGANGAVTLTTGLCILDLRILCTGVLSEFSLTGNFKDTAGNPLYSDSAPASISWSCNATVCPPTQSFVPGSSTVTQLQIAEFRKHTIYVALRNPNGSYQPTTAAPACNGVTGSPLPTGTINTQATGGRHFCVDVGAIRRSSQQCQTVCTAWSGPLTMPILFVEDPRFMAT